MDMDLWWCPVCERAITEREDETAPPALPTSNASRHRSKAHQPQPVQEKSHFTSRGGVYGPKGGLYCSDACRAVEELNGRRAFEELAACLSETGDQAPAEETESDGTLSGTDETNTDRRRSLSLGRGSESGATSERTSGSSPGAPSAPPVKTWGLTPLAAELGTGFAEHTALTARRTPMLLAPNGTPLIQPTFPQRPGPGLHQRRHHSQYAQHAPGLLHATGTSQPAAAAKMAATRGRLATNTSTSVPTYPPSVASRRPGVLGARQLSGLGRTEREDMEFGAEARHTKPTSLWQHYGLFYRSRSTGGRAGWAEWGDGDEVGLAVTPTQSLKTHGASSINDRFRKASDKVVNSRRVSVALGANHEEHGVATLRVRLGKETCEEVELRRVSTGVVPLVIAPGTVGKKEQDAPRKDWRTSVLEESKCSRSWSWDHLPADVPQYPAMDLERVRRSRIELIQKMKQGIDGSTASVSNPLDTEEKGSTRLAEENMRMDGQNLTTMDKELKNGSLSVMTSQTKPIQTRKKLFVFQ